MIVLQMSSNSCSILKKSQTIIHQECNLCRKDKKQPQSGALSSKKGPSLHTNDGAGISVFKLKVKTMCLRSYASFIIPCFRQLLQLTHQLPTLIKSIKRSSTEINSHFIDEERRFRDQVIRPWSCTQLLVELEFKTKSSDFKAMFLILIKTILSFIPQTSISKMPLKPYNSLCIAMPYCAKEKTKV